MITLVIGAMMSGKSTEMLRRLERSYIAKKSTVLLRPKLDNRGFLTHSLKEVPWLETYFTDLADFDASQYDVIGIDEGQFHNGLKEFCLKHRDKQIIISALHATSECEMFEPVIEVLPYCEKIIKLNAVCSKCGNEYGNYSYYLAGDKTEKVAVGGSESYTAYCRECYFEGSNKKRV